MKRHYVEWNTSYKFTNYCFQTGLFLNPADYISIIIMLLRPVTVLFQLKGENQTKY